MDSRPIEATEWAQTQSEWFSDGLAQNWKTSFWGFFVCLFKRAQPGDTVQKQSACLGCLKLWVWIQILVLHLICNNLSKTWTPQLTEARERGIDPHSWLRNQSCLHWFGTLSLATPGNKHTLFKGPPYTGSHDSSYKKPMQTPRLCCHQSGENTHAVSNKNRNQNWYTMILIMHTKHRQIQQMFLVIIPE